MQVSMRVNGERVTREIEPRMLLVHFLRDELGLIGTHWGCDTSNCGVCVVWLHGAVLRSPHAHARIVSIDTSAAEAAPKVKAVITGATLETLKLAWIPALSHDVLAVLATDKVRFQGQEVAFVVAEDRYAARDALELIDVDYEVLRPVIDIRAALATDAPVIRDDIES